MIPLITRYDGRLKIESADKDAQPGRYLSTPVPEHWLEMKALAGHDPSRGIYAQSERNKQTWGFSLFMERSLTETFGTMPKLDVEPWKVTGNAGVIEWLVEQQGFVHTLRLGRAIQNMGDWEDEFREIDPDLVFVPHDRHHAIKARGEETILLLAIKYGEYRTANSRARIMELDLIG